MYYQILEAQKGVLNDQSEDTHPLISRKLQERNSQQQGGVGDPQRNHRNAL